MTIWTPELNSSQAKYLALANAIEEAIKNGDLKPNEKLPPQRRLADALSVTVGTITRAYSEAERRGIVVAKVGSGTYVRGQDNVNTFAYQLNQDVEGQIDMRAAFAPDGPQTEMLSQAMETVSSEPQLLADLLRYAPELGHREHRESFLRWLTTQPVSLTNTEFLITHGGQHAISTAINGFCREGDCLVTEDLVFPGILSAAQDRAVKVLTVESDEEGPIPEKLKQLCLRHHPRILYVTPNSQNPRGSQISLARREELIAVCKENNVLIIEDDVQYLAIKDKPKSMQELAPEQCIYITSFSKRFGGAMRIGVLLAPIALHHKLRLSLRASTWTNSPMLIHFLSIWMDNGSLASLDQWLENEMFERQTLAQQYLAPWLPSKVIKSSFNLWLELPLGWLSHEFVALAQKKGVLVRSADDFRVGQQIPMPAIRMCLSRPNSKSELTEALLIIKLMLESGPILKENIM